MSEYSSNLIHHNSDTRELRIPNRIKVGFKSSIKKASSHLILRHNHKFLMLKMKNFNFFF